MCEHYSSGAHNFAWVKGFREGSITSLSDAPRCRRPLSIASTPNIEELKNLIRENLKQSIRHLAEHLNMGKETVCTILHRELNLRKKISVLVPHVLSDRNKIQRKEWATNVIAFFDCNSMNFVLQHFAVEDDTLVLFDTLHHETSEKTKFGSSLENRVPEYWGLCWLRRKRSFCLLLPETLLHYYCRCLHSLRAKHGR